MAQVDRDHMTELRSAADSKTTAQTAEKDSQLKAVAYAINEAANTGAFTTVFKGVLLDEVKTQLESEGYELKPYTAIISENSTVISWE